MWAKLMSEQPQPVTFEALIDALRAKEEVISEEEVLRFVEALEQQVRTLESKVYEVARKILSGDLLPSCENPILVSHTVKAIAEEVTALLGKP
jgi:anthranilate phosphoribosyltransferase